MLNASDQPGGHGFRRAFLSTFLLAVCLLGGRHEATATIDHWVGTWSTSIQEVEQKLLPEAFHHLDNTTLHQVVRVSIGGTHLRVRLSNVFADWRDDLTLTSVEVALKGNADQASPTRATPVTFHGRSEVTIPHGVLMVSDPVEFNLPAGAELVVSLQIKDATRRISGHRSARGRFAFLHRDNLTGTNTLASGHSSTCWLYLGGIDVLAPPSAAALVCLGDSITDGKGSTEDRHQRWPDLLAQRLQGHRKTQHIGVLNQGIGGNCLWRGGIGETALQRLERDVLSQPGIRWLILMEGINDLGGGQTTAGEMKAAYEQIIRRAHERGLRVFGATLTPCGNSFYDKPGVEQARQEINHWIRHGGAFDAVLDWDAVVRDPDNPRQLLPAADCGDHLHLSDTGYQLLAESIELNLFRKSSR